jgi:nucleotide-binding universal stress UspA family protein
MRILICSDGTDPEDKPARLAGLLAGPCHATVTLLGIIERPPDEEALRAALDSEAKLLRGFGLAPKVHLRAGEPIEEILKETTGSGYDLVIIGARVKQTSGQYWRSQRTYEVIKAIPVPVLVATGECERLSSILVCTGGRHYIEAAVQITGEIATCVGASVTLLHVMAEPPAIYVDLMRREEDIEALLASGSELGRNLQMQKETLEKMGVPTRLRIRHGIVIDQVFEELREGEHDMIVTGSSRAHGALRHYIMGDLTRSILNRAPCPVLVARPEKEGGDGAGIWDAIKRAFSSPTPLPRSPMTR